MELTAAPVYNALHTSVEGRSLASIPEAEPGVEKEEEFFYDDHDDDDQAIHHQAHMYGVKKETLESFDFTDAESTMWRKVSKALIIVHNQ
jgi:hypothetical protein